MGACGARCSVQLGGARVDVCALLAELRPAAAEVRALHGAMQEAAVAPERSLRALCVVVAWAGRAPVLLRVLPSLREALRLLDAASAARLAAAPDAAAACAARAARLVAQVRVRVRANPNPSPNPSPNPNQVPYAEGEMRGGVARVLAAAAAAEARCEAAGLACTWYEQQAYVEEMERMVLADARWANPSPSPGPNPNPNPNPNPRP